MQKQNFQLLANYNRWMNEKLFDASSRLDERELRLNKGAFFGSVFGTLNHLMVGDILWLKRFAQNPGKFQSLENIRTASLPASLDAILYEDLGSLRSARQKLDADIILFSEEVTAQQLAEELAYKDFKGNAYADPLGLLVQHLFNHQTHHRGQISTLFSQSDIDIGPTDLMVYVREARRSV